MNRIALSATRSRLFIDCADFTDEATYTCVAENAFSRISFPTKLNLIKPTRAAQVAGADNELLAGDGEPSSAVESAKGERALSAMPQCLSEQGARTTGKHLILSQLIAIATNQTNFFGTIKLTNAPILLECATEPVRIHMWTHNLIEVVKNNVILYCRSSAKIRQITPITSSQQQSQDLATTADLSGDKQLDSIDQQLSSASADGAAQTESADKRVFVSWTSPDEKLVTAAQKDKYEILETGDLLIKDLRWADMGSYVCTVSDEQSSDSVSAFVYPAAQKSGTSKRSASQLTKKAAFVHF